VASAMVAGVLQGLGEEELRHAAAFACCCCCCCCFG
jgi:hypothetical protein